MRLHRFYIPETIELKQDFWLHDEKLIHQWYRVLRYQAGQQVVLFDGLEHDRLYMIMEIKEDEAHLQLVTEFERKLPKREVYLFWSLLKKDKNDWVLQKCTELGVSHFVPLLTSRTEKTGFDRERAQKIAVEAAEQCGRSDIPAVREPLKLQTALEEFCGKTPLYLCEQSTTPDSRGLTLQKYNCLGVLVGPEGGWTDSEIELFKEKDVAHLNLHDFTLRAETASIAAVTMLLQ